MLSFLPKQLIPKLTDLTPEMLHERDIRLLMLDFDNTVLPYTSNVPSQELLDWVAGMKDAGLLLCVVSNSKKPRAIPFCEKTGIGLIRRANKPFQRGIQACLRQYDVAPVHAALVGDQIYTDTLGANCAGVWSIVVKPIHLHNFWLKARHAVEQPFLAIARRRNR